MHNWNETTARLINMNEHCRLFSPVYYCVSPNLDLSGVGPNGPYLASTEIIFFFLLNGHLYLTIRSITVALGS